MATTSLLPTKSEYENAVEELKALNEDIFYDDFKEKIKALESNLMALAINNSSDFKKEADNVINKASMLYRQMDSQKKEIRDLLETNQNVIVQSNQQFLEEERKYLLFVYEELQKSIALFTDKTNEMQQAVASSNKDLLNKTIETIGSVSNDVKDFSRELTKSNENNRKFLEKNETFVTLTKQQLAKTEEKITAHVMELQQMGNRLEELRKAYEEMFQKHTDLIKSLMVIREEALLGKVTQQLDIWKDTQSKFNEKLRADFEQLNFALKEQGNRQYELLHSISNKVSSKEDLANVEKKNNIRMNLILSITVIEAILIGIKFFI